jgi:hypothetical protein
MSPFRGQFSGKLLLASIQVSIGTEIKAQWRVGNLFRASSSWTLTLLGHEDRFGSFSTEMVKAKARPCRLQLR